MPSFFPDDARCLAPDDPSYPARLRELKSAPRQLWVRGTLAIAEPPAVAIVGTRRCTPYGERVARAIATTCARHGISVVSGLARGIDGVAHIAALDAGGRTVAALGTGIDQYYPKPHRALQDRIARDGLLISEFGPGESGHAGAFPQRNRLIAALADVTVVVEAPESSGALNTARYARELGRILAVVPHNIDSPSGRGCNELLRTEHAEPLLAPDDVLGMLRMAATPTVGLTLDGDAALCWHAIASGAGSAAEIARDTGMPLRQVSGVLAMLEIDGLITFDAAGRVQREIGVG